MKVIRDNEDLKSHIVNGVIKFEEDIKCDFNINVEADIYAWNINAINIDAWNINAKNIDARNIDALNIDAKNIDASNISALNIDALNIYASNIDALNIDAKNIDARNIYAWNINAWNIKYFAFCITTQSLKCETIKAKRKNALHECLDSQIEIIEPSYTIDEAEKKFNIKIKKNLK